MFYYIGVLLLIVLLARPLLRSVPLWPVEQSVLLVERHPHASLTVALLVVAVALAATIYMVSF